MHTHTHTHTHARTNTLNLHVYMHTHLMHMSACVYMNTCMNVQQRVQKFRQAQQGVLERTTQRDCAHTTRP